MREVLQQGLREWKKLSADERKPGAVKVENLGKTDTRYTRTPPPDGLIVNVFTRILDQDSKGALCKGSCKVPGGDAAARDHLWLTREEWQGLFAKDARKGDRRPAPAWLTDRILLYHLVDNTRGEPSFWTKDQVRKQDLTLTVEEAGAKVVRLRLEGTALLATAADPSKAVRGFDARLRGVIEWDPVKKVVERFDLVVLGEHWGEGTYTGNARPGRKPLGVVFELCRGRGAADLVPPQAARGLVEYLGGGR